VPASEDDQILMQIERDLFGPITGGEEDDEPKRRGPVTPSAT
jgi:hypothetical protein